MAPSSRYTIRLSERREKKAYEWGQKALTEDLGFRWYELVISNLAHEVARFDLDVDPVSVIKSSRDPGVVARCAVVFAMSCGATRQQIADAAQRLSDMIVQSEIQRKLDEDDYDCLNDAPLTQGGNQ